MLVYFLGASHSQYVEAKVVELTSMSSSRNLIRLQLSKSYSRNGLLSWVSRLRQRFFPSRQERSHLILVTGSTFHISTRKTPSGTLLTVMEAYPLKNSSPASSSILEMRKLTKT